MLLLDWGCCHLSHEIDCYAVSICMIFVCFCLGFWLIIMYLMEQFQKSNSYFPARLCCHEETGLSESVMTADVFNV